MVEKERVNLTVHPDTKAEWDRTVKESTEYSSLSDLIRTSVTHELLEEPNAATAPDGRETPQTADHTDEIKEMTNTLSSIENTLSDLDERVGELEKEVSSPKRAELKNNIIDALPKIESDEGQDGTSAEAISRELRADRDRVSRMLAELEDTSIVRTVANIEGQQMFARKEEY